ncbi:MAG TPA: hypothetical protein VF129_07595 [Actinomycetota bacterium]
MPTGWFVDRFRVLSYGFRVRSNVAYADEVFSRLLGPLRANGRGALPTYTLRDRGEGFTRRFVLHLGRSKIQEVVSPGSMLEGLIADFCRRAIESTELLAIHAGVVSVDGVAAVFPAPPDAGKTTLTAGLTRVGFEFLSDEVAAIDTETCLVHPFPRPVLMDPSSVDLLDGLGDQLPPAYEAFRRSRYHLAPDDLRPGALGGISRIGLVVVPAYRGGVATTVEPMSRADTLMHLANTAFNLERLGRPGFDALARVARDSRGYRLAIGDLGDAIAHVADLLRSEGTR